MLGTRHPEWKNRNDSCFSTQTLVIADNKQLSCQKKLCCINSFELRKLSNIPGFRYAIQLGEWILSLCVLRECLSVRLRANYVTFLTCLFVRWGKEREKCWNKSMCACVYMYTVFTVCASEWEGDDIVLIRFLRWRLHLARIGNGTEDRYRQRGNKKGKQMEERTDGMKEKRKWRKRLRRPDERWRCDEEWGLGAVCTPANKMQSRVLD